MSIYLKFDTESEPEQIATITGWGDVCRWIADLDRNVYPNIIHLVTFGWEDSLYEVERQLLRALRKYPPDKDIHDTVMGIVNMIHNRGRATVATITDGLSPDTSMTQPLSKG